VSITQPFLAAVELGEKVVVLCLPEVGIQIVSIHGASGTELRLQLGDFLVLLLAGFAVALGLLVPRKYALVLIVAALLVVSLSEIYLLALAAHTSARTFHCSSSAFDSWS
jgi:hypothetical protein